MTKKVGRISFSKVAYNVSRLGEVGDLEAQSLKLLLMFKNSTNDE